MCDQNKDNQLICRILSGNQQAYGELYEKTIPYVYKTVHFLVEEKNDVDDLVQDIYFQVYQSLRKYDGKREFKPWLMGIAMKQIQSYRRKRWMRFRIAKKAEEYEHVAEIDFTNHVVDKMANEFLIHLVNELPFKLKQVVILRYLNDHSQEEVANILEIPVGTVKSRINAALNKLRSNEQGKKIFLEKVRNA
ncbi:sigma-70 family RNA polymerase sigma factor [Bacillus sp. BRMEA1]|uniref:sigma-70 family RNA polymerase sigma factor n=1 Tax=Neobacillus endophyticus TaxID=2738405 RepID=UPI001567584E|nr:sigma-70 family RNA polymerase sigma factor [Neobacillus endophyticus]NRD76813.1 sigma-70 family RNA polymerase sigma factor [Neobacillus endophyticus]